MFKVTSSTCTLLDRKTNFVQSVLLNAMDQHQKVKAAKIFTKLAAEDLQSINGSCFLKIVSKFFIGRLLITFFFRTKAIAIVENVIRNYQSVKIMQFSSQLVDKTTLDPAKDERERIVFLAKHSPLLGEIQHRIRRRTWKKWKALNLPKAVFDRVYPQTSNLWMKLLNDQKIIEFIDQHKNESDNSNSLSQGTENDDLTTTFILVSDNSKSLSSTVDPSDSKTPTLDDAIPSTQEEILFQDLEYSQTLPYYLSSIDNLLLYLLNHKKQADVIDKLSDLAAEYTSKNRGEQERNKGRFKAIFNQWRVAFAKTSNNTPKKTEDHRINFDQYPRIKPFIPLLEYLPAAVKKYKEFHAIFNNDRKALSKINFQNLALLLEQEKIYEINSTESKIASLLIPLLNDFVDKINEKINDKDQRLEWQNFWKESAESWHHPFYSGLFASAEKAPESMLKFLIKKSLTNYIPLTTSLKDKLKNLPKIVQHLDEKASRRTRQPQANVQELQSYRSHLKANYDSKLSEIQDQLKWENTAPAKELDSCVAKIYNDIYKNILINWLNKHSIKNLIKCAKIYRQITIHFNQLLQNIDHFTNKEKIERIARIKTLAIEFLINAIKTAQQYSKEVQSGSFEATLFSNLHEQLLEMDFSDSSLNFTHQLWQSLFITALEDLFEVDDLFS